MNLLRIAPITATLLLSACVTTAPFPPQPLATARAYDGPRRPQADVATVFILDGRPHYESGFICQVNGKPAAAGGGCASVVYLLPGSHRLQIRYRSRPEVGEGEITLHTQAGQLYQLNATSFRTSNRGMIQALPMPAGARLIYRNVAPNLAPPGKLDEAVPYDPQ